MGGERVRKGESRERNYSSSLGKTTQSSFDKMRPYSHFRRSSTVNSTALGIERNRPGPRTSPACTGTVVTLPSTCLKNTGLPRVRTTRKPIFSRIRMNSLPLIRGIASYRDLLDAHYRKQPGFIEL